MISIDSFISQFITPKQGLFLVLGYILSIIYLYFDCRGQGFNNKFLFYNLFLMLTAFCGNIGYNLLYLGSININLFNGGSILGAILLNTLIVSIISLFVKNIVINLNKFILPYFMVITFGKLGCYYGGCCYGISVFYIPLQVVEYIILFLLLIILICKFRTNENLALWSILFYSINRFVVEFFRLDNSIFIYKIPITQIVSLILILYMTFLLYYKNVSKFD